MVSIPYHTWSVWVFRFESQIAVSPAAGKTNPWSGRVRAAGCPKPLLFVVFGWLKSFPSMIPFRSAVGLKIVGMVRFVDLLHGCYTQKHRESLSRRKGWLIPIRMMRRKTYKGGGIILYFLLSGLLYLYTLLEFLFPSFEL